MRFDSFSALFAVSNALLGVSAGPLVAKRQDDAATSIRVVPSVGLVEGTLSNGEKTTYEVFAPQQTPEITGIATATATTTVEASTTTYTFSRTGQPEPISTAFPACSKESTDKNPFCLPSDESKLYYGKTYYATWDPSYFPANSTIQVQIQFSNDSTQQVWSSGKTENSCGFIAVDTKKEWMQGYSMYNLTFHMLNYEASAPERLASTRDGPLITLTNEPPNHYPPPPLNKVPNKEGLLIGLPLTLGFLLICMVGLYFGMRKHRTIGLGNIMGRRKGYGVGKSRRQRMGLGKKGGAIRFEDQEEYTRPQYQPSHGHSDSLGSLVSDDGIRPAPGDNQFRSEIDRQRTGR